MVLLQKDNTSNVALAFKSDDNDKLYYVKSTGVGQPLVLDSTIDPPYIFNPISPALKEWPVDIIHCMCSVQYSLEYRYH